jgi:hypothetical protein
LGYGTYLNMCNMNIDVDIYIKNIIKFFKSNPEELLSLVPKNKEHVFYDKIKEVAIINSTNGDEVALTKKQFVDICLEINNYRAGKRTKDIFQKTKFGDLCLN